MTADRWLVVYQVCHNGCVSGRIGRRHSFTDTSLPSACVSDVPCNPADAAHTAAVSAPQWRAAQAGRGRGSRRTSAKVSGAEQSSSNKMQAEEKSVGDVFREEGGGAHADQHAASGIQLTSGV